MQPLCGDLLIQKEITVTNQLIIANTQIPTDSENRINLNALHKASGLGRSKEPSRWLRLDTTKELIKELEACARSGAWESETVNLQLGNQSGNSHVGIDKTPDSEFDHNKLINKKRGGNGGGGTYAHKLLAISYAGWISPQFQLHVNQVFLNQQNKVPDIELPNRFITRVESDGKFSMRAIPNDAFIANFEQLPNMLRDTGNIKEETLNNIATECTRILANRAAYFRNKNVKKSLR